MWISRDLVEGVAWDVVGAVLFWGLIVVLETAIESAELPIWPDRWGVERLRAKLATIGSIEFARGFQLKASGEDTAIIRPEWITYFDPQYEDE